VLCLFVVACLEACSYLCQTLLDTSSTSSPQDWIKGRDIGLTMPLWTWSEMEKLWQHCYKGKVR
jgi:hypothetical protein